MSDTDRPIRDLKSFFTERDCEDGTTLSMDRANAILKDHAERIEQERAANDIRVHDRPHNESGLHPEVPGTTTSAWDGTTSVRSPICGL